MAHWFACIWYLIGVLNSDDSRSWLRNVLRPVYYGITDNDNTTLYGACLYFVIVTISTVGYGDIESRTLAETIFSLALIIMY
jgi:hypothetical protein